MITILIMMIMIIMIIVSVIVIKIIVPSVPRYFSKVANHNIAHKTFKNSLSLRL